MSTAQLPFHSNSQTDTDSTRTGLDSYLICQLHCGFRGSGDVTEGGEPAAWRGDAETYHGSDGCTAQTQASQTAQVAFQSAARYVAIACKIMGDVNRTS